MYYVFLRLLSSLVGIGFLLPAESKSLVRQISDVLKIYFMFITLKDF